MYDVQAIRQAHPMAEVVTRSGVELRQLGRRLKGRCPFHADTEPSLVVYPQAANYYCFGCGAGGDVIDFVSRVNGVGFREAASLLSGPIARQRIVVRDAPYRAEGPSGEEVQVIDATAKFYRDELWRSPAALAYLALRGIGRQTARECRLGFGAPGLAQHLQRRGLSVGTAQGAGLLDGRQETMLGRIIVPDFRDSQVTWMTGRTIAEVSPRYMNLRLPTPLLGLGRVDGNDVIVAEGVFDWLTIVQWGLPAVALLGTRVSKGVVNGLTRFRRIFVALDSDDAGRRATAELSHALGERAAVIQLPPGIHDLNDLGRLAGSRQAFESCFELATDRKENQWQGMDEPAARRAA